MLNYLPRVISASHLDLLATFTLSFGMWEAPLEGSNIEIQVPPNSLNTSLDDGLGEYKA